MTNRPIASLSPTLLARKGAARPAMRPQIQPLRAFQESTARQLDDLGWNDMGTDGANDGSDGFQPQVAAEAPVQIVEIAPVAPQPSAEIVPLNPVVEPAVAVVPEVVRQQEVLAERVESERVEAAKPRQSALSNGRRAAFTLRLDAERHLKLRLASVTSNRSAQQLVTEALDRLIAELPDVVELAAKVRKKKS